MSQIFESAGLEGTKYATHGERGRNPVLLALIGDTEEFPLDPKIDRAAVPYLFPQDRVGDVHVLGKSIFVARVSSLDLITFRIP